MKNCFGFALADSMFAGDVVIHRRPLTVDEVKKLVAEGVVSCFNPSHKPTIDAMRSRYGIDCAIPAIPPKVELRPGDSMVMMGVRGLPRLVDRHEYTAEEISAASFVFSRYYVFDTAELEGNIRGYAAANCGADAFRFAWQY